MKETNLLTTNDKNQQIKGEKLNLLNCWLYNKFDSSG